MPICSLLAAGIALVYGQGEWACMLALAALSLSPNYLNAGVSSTVALLVGDLLTPRQGGLIYLLRAHIRTFIFMAQLPQRAVIMLDAISRAVYRSIMGRRLMEWHVTSLGPTRQSRSLLIDMCAVAVPVGMVILVNIRAWTVRSHFAYLLGGLWSIGILIYLTFEYEPLKVLRRPVKRSKGG